MIKNVAVVSSEQLFLEGLTCLLASNSDVRISSTGTRVRETLREAQLGQDGVVILDLRGLSETDLNYLIGASEFGGFSVITIGDSQFRMNQGVEAHLDRNSSAEQLHALIQEGNTSLNVTQAAAPSHGGWAAPFRADEDGSSGVKRGRGRPRVYTNSLPLSAREYEAAAMIAKGYTNNHVAESMGLKQQSVKNLVSTIMRKLNCKSRTDIGRIVAGAPK